MRLGYVGLLEGMSALATGDFEKKARLQYTRLIAVVFEIERSNMAIVAGGIFDFNKPFKEGRIHVVKLLKVCN